MKDIIKRLTCMVFGHELFVEVFATEYRCKKGKYRYKVWERTYCARCGQVISMREVRTLSRTDMLKEGWFIVDCSYQTATDIISKQIR